MYKIRFFYDSFWNKFIFDYFEKDNLFFEVNCIGV